jgi:hypothetical protein
MTDVQAEEDTEKNKSMGYTQQELVEFSTMPEVHQSRSLTIRAV